MGDTRADQLIALRKIANRAHASNRHELYDIVMAAWRALREQKPGATPDKVREVIATAQQLLEA
jgi:hypothetical protein